MKNFKKLLSLAVAASALGLISSPAQAVETIVITGPSGTFGNDSVTCAGSSPCSFVNTFNFITPAGFNLANGTLSTSATLTSNIDFTSAFLNDTPFLLTPTGAFEFGTLAGSVLVAGANNVLTVSGTNTGDGSFAGTLTFAQISAVPEPATWGMMLIGFGALGLSLRRRRRSNLAQAV